MLSARFPSPFRTMTTLRPIFRTLLAATALVFAACSDDGPLGPELSELQRAEKRWVSSGIGQGQYTMRRQQVCFCPDAVITWDVTVTAGAVTRVLSPTGLDLPPSQFARFRTVEQLFGDIRAGYATGALKEVAYDSAAGYPTTVSLDPLPMATDDEIVYRTSGVARVP